jgi:hypothetical protein
MSDSTLYHIKQNEILSKTFTAVEWWNKTMYKKQNKIILKLDFFILYLVIIGFQGSHLFKYVIIFIYLQCV